jgi:hypothetical protein
MHRLTFLLVGAAALIGSPVVAATRHNGEAKWPNVERLTNDLYESLAQGRQPYPNPDRQLYVPERDW